jgi:uncharacterized protein (DUF58 family)
MDLYPTRPTFHVAVAGAGLVALGAAARLAPVAAFGGAMLLAVAMGRAIALVAVTRLRTAGFEMVWRDPSRVRRMASGSTIVLSAELRNRADQPVRAVALRPIASTMLAVSVEPELIDLPPQSRGRIDVTVRALRVGRWGVHGLALEVRCSALGGEGLYEVPLHFANPLGLEVVPPGLHALIESPRGGRARRASEAGRPSNLAGAGDELRELRDHAPGDPFKRIAWKASAKRGRLLVREMEREERAVVWLVMDTSIELWAGAPGSAPLDRVVEEVGALATRHLRRGDRVGLIVLASRLRAWVEPSEGAAHAAVIAGALASAASAVDADRSDLEEAGVARRVLDHARPLDPRGLRDVPRRDLDGLARRADLLRSRAPFAPRVPFAATTREQSLRQYLAAFGIESPPRAEGEHDKAQATLVGALGRLARATPRPSIVHVWAPPPQTSGAPKAIAALRFRRIDLRWSLPPFDAGVGAEPGRRGALADVVDDAVRVRSRVTHARAAAQLRRLGIRLALRTAIRRPPIGAAVEVPQELPQEAPAEAPPDAASGAGDASEPVP